MRAPPTLEQTEEYFNALFESYLIDIEHEWLRFDPLNSHAPKILDPKYEKVKVEDVAAAQAHLTPTQRDDLANF